MQNILGIEPIINLLVGVIFGSGGVMAYWKYEKNRKRSERIDTIKNLSKLYNISIKRNEEIRKEVSKYKEIEKTLIQEKQQCIIDCNKTTKELHEKIFELEKELLQKDKTLSLFLASIKGESVAAWTKAIDGKIIWLNEKYGEEFDVDIDEHIGKSDIENWGEEIGTQFRDNDEKLIKSDKINFVDINTEIDGYIIIKWKEFSGRVLVAISGIAVKSPKNLKIKTTSWQE